MNDDKKTYVNSIEQQFEFLVKELEYEIVDRVNSVVWKYVRYRNIEKKRLISVNVDLRDNYVDIALWRLTENNEELDVNSVYLSELIRDKKINAKLKSLPPKALTTHSVRV